WLLRPLLAAAAAGLVARLAADRFLLEAAGLYIGLVLAVALLGIIYLLGVLMSGSISREEIKRLFLRHTKNHAP
ncbi:MAG: hypothetical protein FWB80_13660, partial [Defluviitaleaceae bacterium]|nr:hypothetical protein [Defluviitaleaceae bacterium]